MSGKAIILTAGLCLAAWGGAVAGSSESGPSVQTGTVRYFGTPGIVMQTSLNRPACERVLVGLDGMSALACDADGALARREAATGPWLARDDVSLFAFHGDYVASGLPLNFTADGRYAIAFAAGRVYDAISGKRMGSLPTSSLERRLHLLPPSTIGGSLICYASDTKLWLYNAASEETYTLWHEPEAVAPGLRASRVALSPDHSRLALVKLQGPAPGPGGGRAYGLRMIRVPDGTTVWSVSNLASTVRCLAFSPSGDDLYVGANRTLSRYSADSGEEGGSWAVPGGYVDTMAVYPDGRRLALCVRESLKGLEPLNRILIWDAEAGREVARCEEWGRLQLEGVSPDGAVLWCTGLGRGGRKTLRRFDALTGRLLDAPCHWSRITATRLSPDGRTLVSVSEAGQFRLWDTATGHSRIAAVGRPSHALAFTRDSGWLCWSQHRGGVKAIAITTNRTAALPEPVTLRTRGAVTGVIGAGAGPGQMWISDRSGIALWNLPELRMVRQLKQNEKKFMRHKTLTPSRRHLVSFVANALQARELVNGTVVDRFDFATTDHGRIAAIDPCPLFVASLRMSTDVKDRSLRGKLEAGRAAGIENPRVPNWLELVNLADGRVWWRLDVCRDASGNPVPVTDGIAGPRQAAFDPSGRWLAVTTVRGRIHVYDVFERREACVLEAPAISGSAPTWAPDGEHVVFGTRDGRIGMGSVRPAIEALPSPQALSVEEINVLWDAMGGSDDAGRKAFCRLATGDEAVRRFLRERSGTGDRADASDASDMTRERVERAIARLDSPQYAEREAATRWLRDRAGVLGPVLRAARAAVTSEEARTRLDELLRGGPLFARDAASRREVYGTFLLNYLDWRLRSADVTKEADTP